MPEMITVGLTFRLPYYVVAVAVFAFVVVPQLIYDPPTGR